MKVLIFAFSILFLSACGAAPSEPVATTYPLTVFCGEGCFRPFLEEAVKYWNDGLGEEVFAIEGDTSFVQVSFESKADLEKIDGSFDAFTEFSEFNCNILISEEVLNSVLYTHELGHCLGLPHEQDPSSIMNPNPTPPTKITDSIRHNLGLI